MLTVCAWSWGTKYGAHYVARLEASVRRHLKTPHRFKVFTPQLEDRYLTEIPGCLARLRMFDPAWQQRNEIDRLICLDLDVVVTGPLDEAFDRSEPFVIFAGANASNPCPFNGSAMMLQAGAHPEVWTDFSLDAIGRLPFFAFPDDQGWLHHKLPGAAVWKAGRESGFYAFQKPGWPSGNALPSGAKLVAFPGRRDPAQFVHLDWVKANWRA